MAQSLCVYVYVVYHMHEVICGCQKKESDLLYLCCTHCLVCILGSKLWSSEPEAGKITLYIILPALVSFINMYIRNASMICWKIKLLLEFENTIEAELCDFTSPNETILWRSRGRWWKHQQESVSPSRQYTL